MSPSFSLVAVGLMSSRTLTAAAGLRTWISMDPDVVLLTRNSSSTEPAQAHSSMLSVGSRITSRLPDSLRRWSDRSIMHTRPPKATSTPSRQAPSGPNDE